jgi:predicted MFS family arabinose efflux permease
MDRRIYLLAIGTFAIGTDTFVVAGILPDVARSLGVSVEAAGQMVTIYALTYALGSPFLAALMARLPRQRLILGALSGFAVADLLSAAAPSFSALLAMRVLAGACGALYTPTAYATAATLAPPALRGTALGAVQLGLTGGIVFGVPLGTWIGHHFGWRATFVMAVLLSLLAAAALRGAGLPASPATPPPSLRARLAPMSKPGILLALLPSLLWCAGTNEVYTYSAVLLGPRVGFENIPLLLLAYGVGGLLGSQAGGRMADRFGTHAPIVVCLCLHMLNLALLPETGGTVPGAAAALFVLGLCGWGISAPQQSRMFALEPEHGALVLSLNSSTIYVGTAAGAALGAVLLLHFPPAMLPYVGCMVVGLSLAALLVSIRASGGR